jgi:hypothetical protein
MNIRIAESDVDLIKKSVDYVFIDNDFLGMMYSSPEVLKITISIFNGKILLDPYTRFEFLRDVFDAKIRANKEIFIDSSIFGSTEDHAEVYKQLKEFAMELSQIYASQGKAKGVSLVDLLLASQLLWRSKHRVAILTGNRKDYPFIIFDTVCILNVENQNAKDEVRPISLIMLNNKNLTHYQSVLKKIKEKTSKEVTKEIENS